MAGHPLRRVLDQRRPVGWGFKQQRQLVRQDGLSGCKPGRILETSVFYRSNVNLWFSTYIYIYIHIYTCTYTYNYIYMYIIGSSIPSRNGLRSFFRSHRPGSLRQVWSLWTPRCHQGPLRRSGKWEVWQPHSAAERIQMWWKFHDKVNEK